MTSLVRRAWLSAAGRTASRRGRAARSGHRQCRERRGRAGITPGQYRNLRAAGVDAITLGDHVYKKFDIANILGRSERASDQARRTSRRSAPGKDHVIVNAVDGTRVAVVALLGRTFMKAVDCPFTAIDRVLASLPTDVKVVVVDMHAEATADKYLMAHHLNGASPPCSVHTRTSPPPMSR